MMSKLEAGFKQMLRTLSGENLTHNEATHPSIITSRDVSMPHRLYLHNIFEELITSNNNETETAREVAIWQQNLSSNFNYTGDLSTDSFSDDTMQDYNSDEEMTITFLELNQKANTVARVLGKLLRNHDVQIKKQEDAVVALFMPTGIDRVASQLACFKLGLAYAPLDLPCSDMNLEAALSLIKPLCILTTHSYYSSRSSIFDRIGQYFLVFFDDLYQSAMQRGTKAGNILDEEVLFQANDPLAIVLHTACCNGDVATEDAKIVQITHSNIWNRLRWQWDWFPYQDFDIVCHKASILSTDSIWELYGSLLRGIPVVIVSTVVVQQMEVLATVISQRYITWINLSPTQLKLWLHTLKEKEIMLSKLISLQTVVITGEVLLPSTVKTFFDLFPTGKKIIYLYGCIETCGHVSFDVYTCIEDIELKTQSCCLSVGCPVYNTDTYILDDKQKPVENGSDGEIWISGHCIAKTKWEKNPFIRQGSVRNKPTKPINENSVQPRRGYSQMHGSGDLGFVRDNKLYLKGKMEQFAALDAPLNINKIEDTVSNLEAIQFCVAIAIKMNNKMHVAVFYTLKPSYEINPSKVHSSCARCVSPAMTPAFFQLASIPLHPISFTANRKLLVQFYTEYCSIDLSKEAKQSQRLVEDPDSLKIKIIMASVLSLNIQELSYTDNFFKKGGTKLLAVTCVQRIRDAGFHKATVQAFIATSYVGRLIVFLKYGLYHLKCSEYFPSSSMYQIESLKSDDQEVTYILAQALIENDPLYLQLDFSYEDIANCVEDHRQMAVDSGASLVVRDKEDNSIVGCLFAFNSNQIPNLSGSESLDAIGEYLTTTRPRKTRKTGLMKLSTVAKLGLIASRGCHSSSSASTKAISSVMSNSKQYESNEPVLSEIAEKNTSTRSDCINIFWAAIDMRDKKPNSEIVQTQEQIWFELNRQLHLVFLNHAKAKGFTAVESVTTCPIQQELQNELGYICETKASFNNFLEENNFFDTTPLSTDVNGHFFTKKLCQPLNATSEEHY